MRGVYKILRFYIHLSPKNAGKKETVANIKLRLFFCSKGEGNEQHSE
jgi:hypothetical protein